MDQKSVTLELFKKHSSKNSAFCHYSCQFQGLAMYEGSLQSLSKKAILDLETEKKENYNSLQASTAVFQGQACLHEFTFASFEPGKFMVASSILRGFVTRTIEGRLYLLTF